MTCTLPTVNGWRGHVYVCARARAGDRPICMWHETKPERQVRQSGALPTRFSRVTPLIIIVSLLFFHISRMQASLTNFLPLQAHARTSAPVLIARAVESRQCQCMHIYVSYIWTERNEFRCARRGQRRLALLTMTAVFLVLYFLGVSRIVPRIRYCRRLSGIMKRLLTPVSMSRFQSHVVKVLPFVFLLLTSRSALRNFIA